MSKEGAAAAHSSTGAAVNRTENEFESVDGSSSYLWHSFLLLGGRMLHRALDWYTGFFNLTSKDEAKLYRNLCRQFTERGASKKALFYAKKWSKVEKNSPEPFYQVGLALSAIGEKQRAVAAFDKALKLRPNHIKSLSRKNGLLLEMKNYAEAIAGLEPYVAAYPGDASAQHLLGVAYDGDGQLEKAVACLQRAVALEPDEVKYRQYLGFMNVRREDHKAAAEQFTKVLELERSSDEDDA